MLIYVAGSDVFLAKRALDQLKAKYIEKNSAAELVELDGDAASPNWADLQAVPLFATSRLVVVKQAGLLPAAEQDQLASFAANLPSTTVLVLWDAKKLTPALLEMCRKASKVISVEPMGEAAQRRWLLKRAKELGLNLEPAVVAGLLGAAGGDLWFLETELQYLAASSGVAEPSSYQPRAVADDRFIYFRLVRSGAWRAIGVRLSRDFGAGEPFELTLGSLCAAVRKEVADVNERRLIVELLGDFDFAVKTGLIEPGQAIALLAHHLPNRSRKRVHWEAMWEGLN